MGIYTVPNLKDKAVVSEVEERVPQEEVRYEEHLLLSLATMSDKRLYGPIGSHPNR